MRPAIDGAAHQNASVFVKSNSGSQCKEALRLATEAESKHEVKPQSCEVNCKHYAELSE